MNFRKAYLLLPVCLLLAACGKQADPGTPPESPAPETPATYPDPIGTYRFDGQEHGLYTALCSESDSHYFFVFSPFSRAEGEKLTTYFTVGLAKYFDGLSMEVERMAHNYDYYFIYEDPVCYYSQYRALSGGTMQVHRHGDSRFSVKIDIRLADGTPLSLDYTGDFDIPEED